MHNREWNMGTILYSREEGQSMQLVRTSSAEVADGEIGRLDYGNSLLGLTRCHLRRP